MSPRLPLTCAAQQQSADAVVSARMPGCPDPRMPGRSEVDLSRQLCPGKVLGVGLVVGTPPWRVPGELWELVGPLLPGKERRFRTRDAGRRTPDAGRRTQGAGRKLLADLQVVLYGIPYVLDNDIPWGHNIRPGNRGWARA